jgi:hypothetical protein
MPSFKGSVYIVRNGDRAVITKETDLYLFGYIRPKQELPTGLRNVSTSWDRSKLLNINDANWDIMEIDKKADISYDGRR